MADVLQSGREPREPRRSPRPATRRRLVVVAVAGLALAATAVVVGVVAGRSPTGSPTARGGGAGLAGPTAAAGPASGVVLHQQLSAVIAVGPRLVAVGVREHGTLPAKGDYSPQAEPLFLRSDDGGASWKQAPAVPEPTEVGGLGALAAGAGAVTAVADGGRRGLLAVGPSGVWTSPDGASWTQQRPDPAVFRDGETPLGVVAVPAGWLALGRDGTGGPVLWRSADGRSWQRDVTAMVGVAGPVGEVVVRSVAASGGTVVATGATVLVRHPPGRAAVAAPARQERPAAWASTDGGATFTAADDLPVPDLGPMQTPDELSPVVATPAGFAAIARSGPSRGTARAETVYRSVDGRTWTADGTYQKPVDAEHAVLSALTPVGADLLLAGSRVRAGAGAAADAVFLRGPSTPSIGFVQVGSAASGGGDQQSPLAVTTTPDGTAVAVGLARGADGRERVAIWRQPRGGSWAAVPLASH